MQPLYEALKCKALKHLVDLSMERDNAFADTKTALAKATTLAHLSPKAPIASIPSPLMHQTIPLPQCMGSGWAAATHVLQPPAAP